MNLGRQKYNAHILTHLQNNLEVRGQFLLGRAKMCETFTHVKNLLVHGIDS